MQCTFSCNQLSGCKGWTWVPSGSGGTCYFKKSNSIVFYDADPGYVSGILVSNTVTTKPKPTDTVPPSSGECKNSPLKGPSGKSYHIKCGSDTSVASTKSTKFDAEAIDNVSMRAMVFLLAAAGPGFQATPVVGLAISSPVRSGSTTQIPGMWQA